VGDPEGVPWRVFADEATRRLREAGCEQPEVDARRIVERAAGFDGADFVTGIDTLATERGVGFFDQMLERRLAGEPLQYVVGAWGFRHLDLLVDRRVLIPRPETEVLVEHALAEIDRCDAARVVDLGTGSGAIALSIASERPGVEVWATDSSADALDVARANLAGLGRAATRVRLAEGSWFDALPAELAGRVGVVVSNPPYVAEGDDLPPSVADWEPHAALVSGPAGTEALELLLAESASWLAPEGAVVLELAPWQAEPMAEQARARGYGEVRIALDLAGRERVLIASTRS
jgi:release factor glutamine methyltransferase